MLTGCTAVYDRVASLSVGKHRAKSCLLSGPGVEGGARVHLVFTRYRHNEDTPMVPGHSQGRKCIQ